MNATRWTPDSIRTAIGAHRDNAYEAEGRIEEIEDEIATLTAELREYQATVERHRKAQYRLVQVARGRQAA